MRDYDLRHGCNRDAYLAEQERISCESITSNRQHNLEVRVTELEEEVKRLSLALSRMINLKNPPPVLFTRKGTRGRKI
jgi:hypothetical protein